MIIHHDYPFPVKKMFLQDDIEIAYIEVGKGERTLAFVHGIASYLPVWEKNISVLQKYYRCIALDLPGHGLSSQGDYPYDISFYVSIVKTWLQELCKEKVVLVGHSMGGQVSSRLAIEHPALFSHLILVAPAGFETFTEAQKFMLNQFTTSGIINSSQYLKLILNTRNYFHHLNEQEYAMLKDFSRDFYSPRQNPNIYRLLSRSIKGMTEQPVFDELHKIQLATQVFFGKNDQMIPNRFLNSSLSSEAVAKTGTGQIPGAKLRLYNQCGHFLQFEFPARFNIDVYKFLNPSVFGA